MPSQREAQMMEAIINALGGVLRPQIERTEQRLDALEGERPTLADAFKGGWQAGSMYQRGDIVQRSGATYLCLAETDERPGGSDAWRTLGILK